MAGNKITWDIGLHNPDTHYVYRDSAPIETYDLPTPIATLGGDVNSYEDTDNIVQGNIYHYRIDAEKKGLYIPGAKTYVLAEIPIIIDIGFRDKTLRSFDAEGKLISITEYNFSLNKLFRNSNGNYYSEDSGDRIRKLDGNGSSEWDTFGGNVVVALHVDSDNNAYSYSYQGEKFLKINDNGNIDREINSRNNFNDTRYITSSNDGELLIASNRVYKVGTSYLNILWQSEDYARDRFESVIQDQDGDIYAGDGYYDPQIWKMDSGGKTIWTFPSGGENGHTSSIKHIGLDSDKNLYTGARDYTVKKFDTNGNFKWSVKLGNEIQGLQVDDLNRNIYAITSSKEFSKISSDGTVIYTIEFSSYTQALVLREA